jgi:hypothetical protein
VVIRPWRRVPTFNLGKPGLIAILSKNIILYKIYLVHHARISLHVYRDMAARAFWSNDVPYCFNTITSRLEQSTLCGLDGGTAMKNAFEAARPSWSSLFI